ncbi:unnamed protein product [Caenorhabditis auriculariae]|uniref:PNPLA domain-containing protein n=1 Tax=Caenorhabditis auriculariae TaxID=2777116 RepID=A0A8S1H8S7_9PELO|nr:unnamed protein product [Caenorhabditis auriculariae]
MFKGRNSRSRSRDRNKKPPEKEFDLSNVCNHGEALMHAARFGLIELMFKIFLNHVDLFTLDDAGNNALHVAAMNCQQVMCRMIVVLCAPRKVWMMKNKSGLTPIEVCPDPKIQHDLMHLVNVPERLQDANSRHNTMVAKEKTWHEEDRVLLALDGGGIRASITIQLLLHLNDEMGGCLMDKVDEIAGTSCGGVIALLLTTNNRSIEDCRKFIIEMKDRVFCKNTAKWPKHNSSGIQYIARHMTSWEDSPMSKITSHRVMVTVADSRTVPPKLLLFRSFAPNIPEKAMEEHNFFNPNKVELWKALRCTTAAPYFFESFNGLSDGGLIANNPTLALMSDFMLTNKLEKDYAETEKEKKSRGNTRMGCVVSLGTGIFPIEKIDGIDVNLNYGKNPFHMAKSFYRAIANTKNMFNMLVKECTASNGQPVKYAREWCHSLNVPYYRFSPQLTQGIALDDTDLHKILQVLWETEIYVATIHDELYELAQFLLRKPSKVTTANDNSIKMPPVKTEEATPILATPESAALEQESSSSDDDESSKMSNRE